MLIGLLIACSTFGGKPELYAEIAEPLDKASAVEVSDEPGPWALTMKEAMALPLYFSDGTYPKKLLIDLESGGPMGDAGKEMILRYEEHRDRCSKMMLAFGKADEESREWLRSVISKERQAMWFIERRMMKASEMVAEKYPRAVGDILPVAQAAETIDGK